MRICSGIAWRWGQTSASSPSSCSRLTQSIPSMAVHALGDGPGTRGDEVVPRVHPAAPDDLNGFFAFLIVPPGPPFPEHLHSKNMCGVVWCYTGPIEQAEATFKPIGRSSRRPWTSSFLPAPGAAEYCSMRCTHQDCSGIGKATL